ncbi:molybdopterin molybdenumtransferase MoeA [Nitratireductor sp. CAU 1489]|uniref:Molybdopterin molybdenumtransferase n=1 Tax=Nitratireductor arenosus TaxID=2682096 RepID=A0A844QK45_9HYPH|nr:gephyrin-like molybdotransferase Glp [Nitratireductor arenosus]MVA98964.1 molybdopterin molybdenumtransferase MoeA [Nitratireductor arenosus]
MGLMPVDDALARLLAGAGRLEAETLPIADCAGRVLAAPLAALRTQPPFDASAMDGYAVRAADVASPPARLRVIGQAPAGEPFAGVLGPGEAVRIFTGGVVPGGADSVLIQENTRLASDGVVEATEAVAPGKNIRRRGLDFEAGAHLLDDGRVLDAAALSLAASANHARLGVVKRPLVAILATGDELLPPGSTVGPGQIIASNLYGVAALARSAGADVLDLGIAPDREAAIAQALERAIQAGADIIVTIGGASVGDHDLVQKSLLAQGASIDFWKIAMRPGKPLMAGQLAGRHVLGLPGNPVASLICSLVFLVPLISSLAGRPGENLYRDGVLGSALPKNDLRQDFLRAVVREDGDRLVASAAPVQDSSMLRVLAEARALIVREPFAPAAAAGDPCRLLMLR